MTAQVEILDSAESILNTWGILPVCYDNAIFDNHQYDEWARIVVANGDSFKECIGNNNLKHTGLIIISIFTDLNEGSRAARNYADQIVGLYANVNDGNVEYKTPSITRVGSLSGSYQLNVNIPFEVTEVR